MSLADWLERNFHFRAVLATVTGTRCHVDLADAATTFHEEFTICPQWHVDLSLCFEGFPLALLQQDAQGGHRRTGRVSEPRFTMTMQPWILQAQATAVSLPFLVQLYLFGSCSSRSCLWWTTRRLGGSACRGFRSGRVPAILGHSIEVLPLHGRTQCCRRPSWSPSWLEQRAAPELCAILFT